MKTVLINILFERYKGKTELMDGLAKAFQLEAQAAFHHARLE
jgi:hypothetical protein